MPLGRSAPESISEWSEGLRSITLSWGCDFSDAFQRACHFMADESTSLSLLQRVRQRTPQAWDRLIYLYSPLVEHWCHSWGAQDADIDDVRQEVFQTVSVALPTFRRDRPGDTFRGWLRVIARRRFIDLCRQRARQPEAQGGSSANRQLSQVPEMDGEAVDDPPEQIKHLHNRALELVRSQFEDRTWQAFWRCAVEGESPAEASLALGMTPVAVRQAKSRVLRRLRDELGELLG